MNLNDLKKHKTPSTFFEALALPHLLLSSAQPTTIFEVGSSGNRLTASCRAHLPLRVRCCPCDGFNQSLGLSDTQLLANSSLLV